MVIKDKDAYQHKAETFPQESQYTDIYIYIHNNPTCLPKTNTTHSKMWNAN
jgi:hypothetical protein